MIDGFASRAKLWFRALFSRRTVERELAREMAFHIEMERDKLVREGVARDEAHRRAMIAFGGVQRFTEDVRDARGTRAFNDLGMDVRFAFRYFRRAPVVTGVIVAMLGIGIGANSVLFAIADAIAIQPPSGIPSNQNLVRVRGIMRTDRGVFSRTLHYPEVAELTTHTDVFAAVAGSTDGEDVVVGLSGGANIAGGRAQFVTSGFFSLLGIRPTLGRVLPSDPNDAGVSTPGAIVSHRFWRRELHGDSGIVGTRITVGGTVAEIAGVAPRGFTGAGDSRSLPVTIWLPYSARSAVMSGETVSASARRPDWLGVVARLRDGASVGKASVAAQLVATHGPTGSASATNTADVVRLRPGNAVFGGRSDTPLLLGALGAVTIIILIIVCANISTLLLGRAATRAREISVRLSLGATRARLIRQLVTESTLLALSGGVLGLALLATLIHFAQQWLPDSELTFGWRTIAATTVFAIGTGLVFGLAPALHATRASMFDALKASGSGATLNTLGQRQLVVVQIALSQPLLIGLAVLFSGAFQTEISRFRSEVSRRAIVVSLTTPYPTQQKEAARERERVRELTSRIIERVASVPNVEYATDVASWNTTGDFDVPPSDRANGPMSRESFGARMHPVGQGYFELMNYRLVRGRGFDRTDVIGAPFAVVIGSDFARELWGDASPIGRHLRGKYPTETFTVVGVVDAKQSGPSLSEGRMNVFIARSQDDDNWNPSILIRVRDGAPALIPQIRAVVRAELPTTPIRDISTLDQIDAQKRKEQALTSGAAAGGGFLAMLLAAIGLYAVVSFAVSQRSREIGVRIALGARPTQVVSHFFRTGLKLSVIGSAIGLPASLFAARAFMTGMQYRGPGAWMLAGVISAIVTLVALVATWLPACRAARVDPTVALYAD